MRSKRAHVLIGFPNALTVGVTEALVGRQAGEVLLIVEEHALDAASRLASRLGPDVRVLAGSPQRIDFALPGPAYLDMCRRLTTILDLTLPDPPGADRPSSQARERAREVIELASASTAIERVVVLSHIDVAGSADGVFAERDLDVGQTFPSPQSEDRFRAERIYRRFARKLPVVVLRAGWIVGTGRGLCPLVHLLCATAVPPAGRPMGVVHAMDLTTAIRAVTGMALHDGEMPSDVFHLVPRDPPAVRDLAETARGMIREFLPEGFDIATAARRCLRRDGGETSWSEREFLPLLPRAGRIEAIFSKRAFETMGLRIDPLDSDTLRLLASVAAEEMAGFR